MYTLQEGLRYLRNLQPKFTT